MSGPSSTERNKEIVRTVLERVFEQGDDQTLNELVAADYVDHEAPADMPRGRQEMGAVAAWLRASFSGLRYVHEDAVAEGDRVVTRVIFHGRHTGEFLGIPPTGRDVAWKHIHVWRIADGQIAEHWACRDDVGMLTQLGRPPALAA